LLPTSGTDIKSGFFGPSEIAQGTCHQFWNQRFEEFRAVVTVLRCLARNISDSDRFHDGETVMDTILPKAHEKGLCEHVVVSAYSG
jgi:hypothetical protein